MVEITLFFLVFLIEEKYDFVNSLEFNREFIGVNFSPYVKMASDGHLNPCAKPYTVGEMKTMLEVVATKFSRVSTETVGTSSNAEYFPNNTYYNSPCIIARTAEVAAMINKQANNKTLSVLIGIMTYEDKASARGMSRTTAELSIALEAAKIANGIFPGTVEGLQVFVKPTIFNDTNLAQAGLDRIKFLKKETKGTTLKIGAFTEVHDFTIFGLSQYLTLSLDRDHPRSQLLEKIDFFNCKVFPNNEMAFNGPNQTFTFLTSILTTLGPISKAINSKLQLMGSTGWSSKGNNAFENVENMKTYWGMMNDFASKQTYTIWLNEAFDNPWKRNNSMQRDFSHYGWWRLTNENLLNDKSAYVEKILELKEDLKGSSSLSGYIGGGVAMTLVIIMFLVGLMFHIYRNIISLKQVLTDEEIEEFKFGSSDANIQIIEHGYEVCGKAMKKPYDQSLEIPKEMLEICWNEILGAGQFGSVHKAVIKGLVEKEIALKTTKVNCPSTALRGLLSEIKILSHLGQHINIVSICGACTAELTKNKVYVALELCGMGSLKNHLTKLHRRKMAEDGNEFCIQDNLLKWSCEIANGMEHIGRMSVVHADLATRNVLLTNEGVAKIADFGLSRRLYEYSEYVKKGEEPIPWRWMAIESLKMKQFSCRSDVWSFGITLWEIFSVGAEPYSGCSCNGDFIEGLENGSGKLNHPSEATSKMYQIMQDCWNLKPNMRPNFTTIKHRISEDFNDGSYELLYDTDL